MSNPPADALIGPCKIPCGQFDGGCDVEAGRVLLPVPRPRHAWSDVLICPNEGCGRAFLLWRPDKPSAEPTP